MLNKKKKNYKIVYNFSIILKEYGRTCLIKKGVSFENRLGALELTISSGKWVLTQASGCYLWILLRICSQVLITQVAQWALFYIYKNRVNEKTSGSLF